MANENRHKRQWRAYKTATGNSPVMKFLRELSDEDLAEVRAAMDDVEEEGVKAARHLAGEIYEVRAEGRDCIYRVLFARVGNYKHVLLSLVAFKKKTQKTPPNQIQTAETRLADWVSRAKPKRKPSKPKS